MTQQREKILTVTAKDCEWDYFRGSGKGGQKKNKTSNAVRCRHLPSGAVGEADEGRSQLQNRQKAFRRMGESKEFIKWVRIEAARLSGELLEIQKKIDRETKDPTVTIVEGKNDKDQWVRLEDECSGEK